jgi:transposase InsO family protein
VETELPQPKPSLPSRSVNKTKRRAGIIAKKPPKVFVYKQNRRGILELLHHRRYGIRSEAIQEISEYKEIFYNLQRRQATLGYLSPAAYQRQFYAMPIAA